MQYFSAQRIHNGFTFEKEASVLAFSDAGIFDAVLPLNAVDPQLVQHFEGTLMPGMVNAHCHLELSHTKGLIPEHTGLVAFLGKVVSQRTATEEQKSAAITAAIKALQDSGCIAVGDIANGTDTVLPRLAAKMHIHTFVETMGFVPEGAAQRFAYSKQVWEAFAAKSTHSNAYELHQSIVPHAPYSVSDVLFEHINQFEKDSLLSIHMEECAAENEYFVSKTGDMHQLYIAMGINDAWFKATGKHALPSILPYFDNSHKLLLVHNTFINAEDIAALKTKNISASFCLCPNANLYIENRLPDVPLLADSGINICLGTDSLASNHQLNVYAEVLQLAQHFPQIEEATLLAWASSGGAKALGLDHIIGSFTPGLQPGLVHLHQQSSKRIL